ncbi:transport and Golgi organization protein 1 homolog isoform X2 [Talpa occidentalis]|uniref:transport and Golgi organization protein 1 homolog isoform X2 n=1 Tax=Talpa occidentalis TaxID=50954 RepID=UPI00188E4C8F|nr:transport and Golgi organization protein 1 homolog isoform X2 [Talpa occidentalis]
MAAAPGLLLWLLLLGPPGRARGQQDPGPGRRFSEHKLCADPECSMLMYRGEALEDFTGPDCRFVNFKKGDPIYVYYKLEGRWPEVWAGSVGRTFGYFPKDLIQVVHKYTKEELQVPADETDFVCFDGERDDFDNYNVEELLRFLELHDSTTGDSEKTVEKSQLVGKSPEVSEESDPDPELEDFNSEESESLFLENNKELKDRHEGQMKQPHVNGQTHPTQGERSAFEPFEKILHEQLKVPESENNKTSNSSPISAEQEKIDAYKLLKTEMTLDLKTKFASTADALVSDDETTRLVTSLEDDFDEELDAEYYTVGKEEEESQEDFDELPLLTFTHGEDKEISGKPGIEKHSTDKEQNPSQGDAVRETQLPGIKNDLKHILTTWEEDTIFSVATGGKDKTDTFSEHSNTEAGKEGADESKWGKPSSARDDIDPEEAGDALLVAEVSKTDNDKEPEADKQIHAEGKEKKVESKRSLVEDQTEAEKQEGVTRPHLTQSSNQNTLPASGKGQETLKSAFDNKESDPKVAVVQISKEMLGAEKPGEQILGGDSESKLAPPATGKQLDGEKVKQESMDVAPPGGDNQHNISQNLVQEVAVAGSGSKTHPLSVEHPGEAFQEERLLQTQNQPRFSSPDEISLPRELEEEVPIWGRNLSRHQEREVAAAANKHIDEKMSHSRDEVREEATDEESVLHSPVPGTWAGVAAGLTVGVGVPGLPPEEPGAEDDDPSEELLEDENAVSAKQAQAKPPEVQDSLLAANPQVPEGAALGTVDADPETKEIKETNVILERERKSETGDKGTEPAGRGLGSIVPEKGSPFVGEEAQNPPEISDSPDMKKNRTPGLGEMLKDKDSAYLEDDDRQDLPKNSRLSQKPGPEELSKEGQKDSEEKLMGTESQGSASEGHEEDLPPWTPHAEATAEHSDSMKDLPIINSFFKDQQSLQRFQKYFDVQELEAMFREMSLKLKEAQQDSLPYNVDKVLDKVFRASESHILSVAEKMLDARVTENGDLGMKDNIIFEEAAVLDDIQDLIYFVRYKHSTVEETVPLGTPQPPEDEWGGPLEELQPPLEDNVPHDKTEGLNMQIPGEPSHWDQPVTSDTGTSEVSQKPKTETEVDPGIIRTEATPIIDAKEQPEAIAEEPASGTLLENAVLLLSSFIFYLTKMLVAKLPDDVQPGPDFYGLPWKPVLMTVFLGIVSFSIFFWRTVLVVKSRVYQVTEQQISEKVKNIKKENAELVQKLLDYEQKIKESKKHVQETKKQNTILSDEAVKFKNKIKTLEESKEALDDTAKSLRVMLESEREENAKNKDLILENKKSIEKLKDVISMNASELSEVQIALNEAKLSEEKVKSECHRVQEENAKLKKKKEQLQQEVNNWSKSHSELSEQIKSFERSQKDLEVTLTHKDDNISALTNCITQLYRLDSESEPEGQTKGGNDLDELANGEVAGDPSEKMKAHIKQLMDVSRTQTALSVVDEDLKILQCKLRASMSTKCVLEDEIKKLEDDRNSLQSVKAGLEDECKTLRQKVEILNELYQQKEMALQKKLSQEEYERQEREQRLSAADEKAVLAAEEVKTYKRRIEEMEEELQKTERSFKNQIATHEKKAHDNWLKARAAERAMAEEKREAANLRHKLLEVTQKMAMLQEEPVIVKPMPGRPIIQNPPRRGPFSRNGSFGPSPVSGGECSPPLTADSPARPLSATLGPREVPPGEFDPESGAAPMMNSNSRGSSPSKVLDEGKVNVAAKGPPPFPGAVPYMSTPMGGPIPPPPIRYGPPPAFCGPFGPRPLPPPFGPGMRPPLGPREYVPGIPPGKMPFDPREFAPGHPPFRPLGPPGPREYFIPGPRMPPPAPGPQDYPPPPAARDFLPSGSRDQPPPASWSSSQDCSQTFKQGP